METREKRQTPVSPEEDEWGFYDPEQAGLPAVLGRLEANSSESAASYAARIARTLRGSDPVAAPVAAKKTASK